MNKLWKKWMFAGLVWVLPACGSYDHDVVEDRESSYLCVRGADESTNEMEVVVGTCFNYNQESYGSCSVEMSGNSITVSSRFELITERNYGDVVTSCKQGMATCEVGALEDGEYQINHGEASRSFVIPDENALDCYILKNWEPNGRA